MNKIREYFTFTRSERNGILVLLVLIVILTVTPSLLDLFLKKQKVDYSQFEAEIDKFIASSQNQEIDSNENNINLDTIKKEYFPFDPNNVTEIELYKLGLSQKLVKTWLNFRNKGGKFYDKDDVKKIYGLPDSVFKKIEPYITIVNLDNHNNIYNNNWKEKFNSNWIENKSQQPYCKDSKTTTAIEINNADTAQFSTLPGIGYGYARLIIKYRERLGGFVKKEQLLEVYGFTNETYLKIVNLVYVDATNIRKINLNKAEYKDLYKHPYFSKDLINRILEYRKIQGKINNIDEMVKNKMITQEEADKIKPYSEF